MNILITAPSLNTKFNVSGVSTVVTNLINNNKSHTYFHYLLGRPDEKISIIIWLITLVKQLLFFPYYLKRNKIDIVHQNLPFDEKGLLREYVINWWCSLLKTPVLLHVHGGKFLMNKTTSRLFLWIVKYMFSKSKCVVVLSELEKESLTSLYGFSQAIPLPNSINSKEFFNINAGSLNKLKPRILFMGRIHESKGVEEIYQALISIDSSIEFKFVLCGTGPLKEYLVKKCEIKLGDKFAYKGIVSGAVKNEIIKSSDIFLLPSRYGEGLPMALLETMAAGVVPIVTNDASMKYVIKNNTNGILVEKNSPEGLKQAIIGVLKDPKHYKILSNNAKETIVDNYDIGQYVKRMNIIYSSIKEVIH